MNQNLHSSTSRKVRLALLATTLLGAAMASGCNTLGGLGGESALSCPLPKGSTCAPIGAIYKNQVPVQTAVTGPTVETPTVQARETSIVALPSAPTLVQYKPSLVAATRSVLSVAQPMRSPTRMLRIWVAPYEDDEGGLRDQAFWYVMIDSGKWQIEHSRTAITREFAPTRAARSNTNSATPPTVMSSTASPATSTSITVPAVNDAFGGVPMPMQSVQIPQMPGLPVAPSGITPPSEK